MLNLASRTNILFAKFFILGNFVEILYYIKTLRAVTNRGGTKICRLGGMRQAESSAKQNSFLMGNNIG